MHFEENIARRSSIAIDLGEGGVRGCGDVYVCEGAIPSLADHEPDDEDGDGKRFAFTTCCRTGETKYS